jgi:hypothetical protein
MSAIIIAAASLRDKRGELPETRAFVMQRKGASAPYLFCQLPAYALHIELSLDHCCFSQNDSRPCDAEPPITHGMPTATWPSAAAETQPSATAPTPTWPQKSRLRLESEPLVLSSSTAASAPLRTAAS